MNIHLHVHLPESLVLKRHHVHIIATEGELFYIVFCALYRDMFCLCRNCLKKELSGDGHITGWIQASPAQSDTPSPKWPWAVRAHQVLSELSSELLMGYALHWVPRDTHLHRSGCRDLNPTPDCWVEGRAAIAHSFGMALACHS